MAVHLLQPLEANVVVALANLEEKVAVSFVFLHQVKFNHMIDKQIKQPKKKMRNQKKTITI